MASITEHTLRMRNCFYLGKIPGLGGILFVAAPAQIRDIGQLRHVRNRVFRMLGQRAMAGFATNSGMLSTVMHFGLLVMTHGALTVAGISNGARRYHIERSGAVVSVLPKALGHHGSADYQEKNHSGQQDQRGSNEVSGITE